LFGVALASGLATAFAACGGGGGSGGTPPPPPVFQQTYNPTSFVALFHVAGDSFVGFSSIPENTAYNDLATQADRGRLLGDLIAGVDVIWAPTGVQIDTSKSAITDLRAAAVQVAQPSLVVGGLTVTGDTTTSRQWGTLGAPVTDPTFSLAADVFLVQRATQVSGVDIGGIAPRSGTFVGAGTSHGAVFALFTSGGAPYPVSLLKKTMGHELGHFLSLIHTTETNFVTDDVADTPFCTLAVNDTDHNGRLDFGDDSTLFPDGSNLMFPFGWGQWNGPGGAGQIQLTPGQGAKMRAYLTVTPH
jgi:hypothetical protein